MLTGSLFEIIYASIHFAHYLVLIYENHTYSTIDNYVFLLLYVQKMETKKYFLTNKKTN